MAKQLDQITSFIQRGMAAQKAADDIIAAATHGSMRGDQETDALRLNDLATQHGLKFRRVGRTYQFDDFTAHGLKQALGFVEGYDRGGATKRA